VERRGGNVVVIPYEIVNESEEVEIEVNRRVIKRIKHIRTSSTPSLKASLSRRTLSYSKFKYGSRHVKCHVILFRILMF
jgi:small subunit ribosomal protein S8e